MERMDTEHGLCDFGDRPSPLVGRRWPVRHDGEPLDAYLDRVARWADGWQ